MSHLSNLELFVRVVEEGNFSAASRSIGITPSAVSRQISQLETELGGRLFQRTTRRQSLTEAGEIYYQHARRLVEGMEIAQLAVKTLTNKPSGTLRITAEADFALAFIEPILPEFLTLYPDIQVNLHMSAELKDPIGSNLDLAIRIGHLEDSSLAARKLTESQSIVCASPRYLSKHGTPSIPNDLTSHSCLSFRTQSKENYWCFNTFNSTEESLEVLINGCLNVNSIAFLRNAALNDLGIIMVPSWVVHDELKDKRLIPVLENYSVIPPSIPINAIFANNRQLAPKVRAFIDFLVKRIKMN